MSAVTLVRADTMFHLLTPSRQLQLSLKVQKLKDSDDRSGISSDLSDGSLIQMAQSINKSVASDYPL